MGTSAPRILVADDQADILQALRLLLRQEGFEVETAASPGGVLAALEQADFDTLLMDLNYTRDTTSGREGLDVLARIRQLDASLPVVVMTAFGSVEGAVEAMRHGARDYLEKPWDNARLVAPCCAPRWSSGAPCGSGSDSRERIRRCAARAFRTW